MIMPILEVKDLDASTSFYKDKLGLNHGVTMPDADGKPYFAIVSFNHDKASFGLQLSKNPSEHRGEGVVLMFYVGDDVDLESYYADVQQKGVTIVEPLKTEYWGDQLFSVKDPDGYYISLCKTVKQMTMDEIADASLARG